ncbi:glycosyltransferase family 4 protein [Candidatus Gottesmanbacteria bacterium]|nr:glycosyltransferase family 4 protein [Candidatus Gottesmanbacteria bacterium]
MKILFSLTYYTPYLSGLTLYVKRLAEALAKKDYQITVLSMQYDKKLPSEETIRKVKIVRAKVLGQISKGFISLDWIIKSWQEVRKNDVIIVNLPQFEGIIPALFGKILGKKVISMYHCEVVLPSGILNTVVEWLLHFSHLITLSISDKVITYTKDFADHSKILPHFRSKLEFVYPPIIEPKINKRVQKILMDKIDLKGQFVIGLAARLAAEKGIEYLLEAIPEIELRIRNYESRTSKAINTPRMVAKQRLRLLRGEGIKIAIAGSLEPVGEEKYKGKILNLVEKYKDHVVFLGELKEEEMGAFYSLCDVLVLPSINSTEAFGMVQVEAMMMGVPVVATDLPGVRVPIQKTGMGKLVPAKNSHKLAEAVIEILLNRKKYIKNKEFIKEEFSFDKTIKFYEKLVGRYFP